MEPEYTENHGANEARVILEEKAVCDQPLPDTVFRRSIIFLKVPVIKQPGRSAFVRLS